MLGNTSNIITPGAWIPEKNINMTIQGNLPPPESSNPFAVVSEKCSIPEAQDNDFKVSITDMFKGLKEYMNKSLIYL